MVMSCSCLLQRAQPLAQGVQLPQRGGVLFPGRIVVEGEHAAVLARLADRARHHAWPPRCARGRPAPGGPSMIGAAADGAVRADAARCRPRPRSRPWRVCAPMRTLWPIWIRLSSLTPSSITVSSSAPRSMQVLAPISTSSPMRTRAELLDLLPAPLRRARSRSRRRRSPRRCARCSARRCGSRRRASRAAPAACRRRPRRRAPTWHCAPMTAPAPITRAAPTIRQRADAGARRRCTAPGSTTALGCTPRPARRACAPPTTGSAGQSRGRGRRVTMAAPRAAAASRSAGADDHAAGARVPPAALRSAGWPES